MQLPDVIKTRLISILMGATNAASRGGHRALAIPQSFLHTPSDSNPACDGERHSQARGKRWLQRWWLHDAGGCDAVKACCAARDSRRLCARACGVRSSSAMELERSSLKSNRLSHRAPPLSPEQRERAKRASEGTPPPPAPAPDGSDDPTSLKSKTPPLPPQQMPERVQGATPPSASPSFGSPRTRSPRRSSMPGSPSAGPARSPRPGILHAQQRSVGAADLENTAFAAQAVTPQTMRRSQILVLDPGHARVHLSPRGQFEERGAQADRNLRRLLGTDRLHWTGSSPGRSESPGSARVRDTLARQRLVQESEAAAKRNARQQSWRQERDAVDQPVPASTSPQRRGPSNFASALAEARARTSSAVAGAAWTPYGCEPQPEPEPKDESLTLVPDTVVSQWGAYMGKLQQQPSALQSSTGKSGTPRVEDAAKAEILRAQKARLRGRTVPQDAEEPPEPVLPPPEPKPAVPVRKPVLCVQGGAHTHGPDGCALCNSVREAALNGTLVVPENHPSPGKWLSDGSPTPAQLGYKYLDPKVPQLVHPSFAQAYQSPLRRGESLRSGRSTPSLRSPPAGRSGGLFGSPALVPSSPDGGEAQGYVSPLRKSTWKRHMGVTPS